MTKPNKPEKSGPDNAVKYKTAALGLLGKKLSGSALGVLTARFVLWCRENGFAPVLDFNGVEFLGNSFLESAYIYYEDFAPSVKGDILEVLFLQGPHLKNPDDARFMCQFLSCPAKETLESTSGGE